MPGFVDYHLGERCPDCDGRADWILNVPGKPTAYFHKAWCPTQPGHEEAQRLADVQRAERRRKQQEWMNSPEAARLRALRTVA